MTMPFANLSRKVKRLLKRSTKGHRIRITPFGTNLHEAVGTINPEYSVIHLEDSSTSFVKMEREYLENAQEIDDKYVAIMIPKKFHEEAVRGIDGIISRKPSEQKKWKKRESLLPRFSVLANVKENPKEKMKSNMHRIEGIYYEMMFAGLVPMHEPPPFPLDHVTQLRYGCDFLVHEWIGNILHLHWIEANIERNNSYPTLTKIQRRFRDAIQNGKVVNHYHHKWVDGEGNHHWD